MTELDPWLQQFNERRQRAKETPRSFEFEGETISYKPFVAPEVGLRRQAFQQKINEYLKVVAEAKENYTPIPEMGVDDETMLGLSESVIYDCLTPEGIQAWERIRDPSRPDPLGLLEIYGFSGYLLSKVTEVPTDGAPASSPGQQNGRTSSKDESPSKAGTRKR